jgi:putative endonuclease
MDKVYTVYIMTSQPRGTLYIGITNDIARRVSEHKYQPQGFVKRYKINQCVYIKDFYEVEEAIAYEKLLKTWYRKWKIALIEEHNPYWQDMSLMMMQRA